MNQDLKLFNKYQRPKITLVNEWFSNMTWYFENLHNSFILSSSIKMILFYLTNKFGLQYDLYTIKQVLASSMCDCLSRKKFIRL